MRHFSDLLVALSLVSTLVSPEMLPAQIKALKPSHLFDIKGNERTRGSYITELAEACLEDRGEFTFDADAQLALLNQCLMNAKIFANVSSRFQGNRIEITVDEKWTLIPAPFVQSSGSTRKAGLIVFETNFLGKGLTLALGGNTSNKGSGYFVFFTNPSILGSRFFTSISSAKESNVYELIEHRETVSDAFLENNLGVNLSGGYRFRYLNMSAQLGRTERRYDQHENYLKPESYSFNRAGITFDVDQRDYKLYFSDGFFGRFRYHKTFAVSDERPVFQQWEGTVSWQHDVILDHALYLMAAAAELDTDERTDAERVGSSKGFRGLETRTAWAKRYFVQSAEYQVPLYRFEKGTLTTAAFHDHGLIKNQAGTRSQVEYNATGVGLYFYLSRIALPGMGLEFGTNSKYQKSFVNFSLGMTY